MYGRLSETYDAAESVPTQLERGTDRAERRRWAVVATFKDDGYSAFKEVTRDGFAELVEAIEAGQVDVVIVRDIDRLTRNLAGWNAFEKACVRHGVRLSAYTAGPGPVHGRRRLLRRDGDTARSAGKRGKERAGPRSPGPRGAQGSAAASGGSDTPPSTPTRTSRTTRSGSSRGRTLTRPRRTRSARRRAGYWRTAKRSHPSCETGPGAASSQSTRKCGGRPLSWAR